MSASRSPTICRTPFTLTWDRGRSRYNGDLCDLSCRRCRQEPSPAFLVRSAADFECLSGACDKNTMVSGTNVGGALSGIRHTVPRRIDCPNPVAACAASACSRRPPLPTTRSGRYGMGAAGFSHEDIRDVERSSVRRATATYRRMTIRHGGADLEASVIAQEGEPTAALSANAVGRSTNRQVHHRSRRRRCDASQ